jgi:glutaredoxin
MDEDLDFTEENGEKTSHNVKIYALSTCGFCARALKYLRENSISFRFVYVDQLPYEVKDRVKSNLKETYNQSVAFPFMVVDENTDTQKVIVGFLREEYEQIFSAE